MNQLARHRRLIALATLASALVLVAYAAMAPSSDDPPRAAARTAEPDHLLPVPAAELSAAADLARRLITAYGNYRYDESPQAYLARLAPLITSQLYEQLQRAAHNPAVLQERQHNQTAVTTEAAVVGTRDIQATSIIVLVTGHRQITQADASSQDTETFAVTVVKHHSTWLIAGLTLAAAGQEGDVSP